METLIRIQSTPNPNALKFIVNKIVKSEGKATFKNAEECHTNPLARQLFTIPHVDEIYFFENVITVTQDGNVDWSEIEDKTKDVILSKIDEHDPNFKVDEATVKPQAVQTPEIAKIEAILDRTVRPALQGDGGDLQVLRLDGNILTVYYQGACGSCPSSTAGTLKAIEGILKEEFNPDIVVETAAA